MTLAGIVMAVIAVLAAAVALVIAHNVPAPHAASASAAPGGSNTTAAAGAGGGDAAAENALAAQPMVQLPAQAAQPQALTTMTAGPPIAVPQPTVVVGQWIPGGFPNTPEGALGQLRALNETALAAGDPQVYANAYQQLSLPGAPNPGSTGLYSLLSSMRSHAGLADTGPVGNLTVSYHVTQGQVKGTAAGGRYAVVCVLGQLSVGYQGQVVDAGVGDCQAMSWTGTAWWIAPGALAAPAPSAWPGSADAVKAGYRGLS